MSFVPVDGAGGVGVGVGVGGVPAERVEHAENRLADGLKSLAPGRSLSWPLGQGFNLLNDDGPQSYTFTVTADGPFGPVPPLTYVVDTSEWKGTSDRPSGSLDQVREAIAELTKKIGR